mmetsp:Transcript_130704/g.378139  ORF Transcript_130704/g.378139 Transcript_130704/m.378139 type:complete len:249 (+) Transcript_130704:1025-1771(+)
MQGHACSGGQVLSQHVGLVGLLEVGVVGDGGEERPHPGVALSGARESDRVVGVGKAELFLRAVRGPQADLDREADDIGGVNAVLRVLQWELLNARLVGMAAHLAIRDAHCDPHSALLELALPDQLHDPDLARVADRERLALGNIPILGDQAPHSVDRLPRRLCPLQGDPNEAAVVQEPLPTGQRLVAAEGRLPDGQAMLVEVANDVESLWRFVNLAEVSPGVPIPDLSLGSRRILRGGVVPQCAEKGP